MAKISSLKFDPAEFEKFKKQNFQDRLNFIDLWSNYMKKNTNKVWSKQQKIVIDTQMTNVKNFKISQKTYEKMLRCRK